MVIKVDSIEESSRSYQLSNVSPFEMSCQNAIVKNGEDDANPVMTCPNLKPPSSIINTASITHIANRKIGRCKLPLHLQQTLAPLARAKKIRFYRNGDRYHSGVVYALSRERYRDLTALMNDLNRSLADRVNLPYGVRYIFILPSSARPPIAIDEEGIANHRQNGHSSTSSLSADKSQNLVLLQQRSCNKLPIKAFDILDFEDGDSCVCSSFDRFEALDYTRNNAPRMWNFAKHDNPFIAGASTTGGTINSSPHEIGGIGLKTNSSSKSSSMDKLLDSVPENQVVLSQPSPVTDNDLAKQTLSLIERETLFPDQKFPVRASRPAAIKGSFLISDIIPSSSTDYNEEYHDYNVLALEKLALHSNTAMTSLTHYQHHHISASPANSSLTSSFHSLGSSGASSSSTKPSPSNTTTKVNIDKNNNNSDTPYLSIAGGTAEINLRNQVLLKQQQKNFDSHITLPASNLATSTTCNNTPTTAAQTDHDTLPTIQICHPSNRSLSKAISSAATVSSSKSGSLSSISIDLTTFQDHRDDDIQPSPASFSSHLKTPLKPNQLTATNFPEPSKSPLLHRRVSKALLAAQSSASSSLPSKTIVNGTARASQPEQSKVIYLYGSRYRSKQPAKYVLPLAAPKHLNSIRTLCEDVKIKSLATSEITGPYCKLYALKSRKEVTSIAELYGSNEINFIACGPETRNLGDFVQFEKWIKSSKTTSNHANASILPPSNASIASTRKAVANSRPTNRPFSSSTSKPTPLPNGYGTLPNPHHATRKSQGVCHQALSSVPSSASSEGISNAKPPVDSSLKKLRLPPTKLSQSPNPVVSVSNKAANRRSLGMSPMLKLPPKEVLPTISTANKNAAPTPKTSRKSEIIKKSSSVDTTVKRDRIATPVSGPTTNLSTKPPPKSHKLATNHKNEKFAKCTSTSRESSNASTKRLETLQQKYQTNLDESPLLAQLNQPDDTLCLENYSKNQFQNFNNDPQIKRSVHIELLGENNDSTLNLPQSKPCTPFENHTKSASLQNLSTSFLYVKDEINNNYLNTTISHDPNRGIGRIKQISAYAERLENGFPSAENELMQLDQGSVENCPVIDDTPCPKFITKKYAVYNIIGDGNFAIVKECQNKKTGQYYALKIIDKTKCKTNIERQMIANEVSILRRISHPNIVQLFEEYETTSKLYLVMELVKGGDLFDVIARETKFGEYPSSRMIYDLTQAVRYLHYSLNVVHRDIKPENLLVYEYGDGSRVLKLADFGLAIHVNGPLYTVCGTPAYVAPEILAETGYGIKIDIWATGVIMYILLCGFPPFDNGSGNQDALFDMILTADVEFPQPFWTNVSECAKDLIKNMLQADPNCRYSALDVLMHPWITSQINPPLPSFHNGHHFNGYGHTSPHPIPPQNGNSYLYRDEETSVVYETEIYGNHVNGSNFYPLPCSPPIASPCSMSTNYLNNNNHYNSSSLQNTHYKNPCNINYNDNTNNYNNYCHNPMQDFDASHTVNDLSSPVIYDSSDRPDLNNHLNYNAYSTDFNSSYPPPPAKRPFNKFERASLSPKLLLSDHTTNK